MGETDNEPKTKIEIFEKTALALLTRKEKLADTYDDVIQRLLKETEKKRK